MTTKRKHGPETLDEMFRHIGKRKRRGEFEFSYSGKTLIIGVHCEDDSVFAWECEVLRSHERLGDL